MCHEDCLVTSCVLFCTASCHQRVCGYPRCYSASLDWKDWKQQLFVWNLPCYPWIHDDAVGLLRLHWIPLRSPSKLISSHGSLALPGGSLHSNEAAMSLVGFLGKILQKPAKSCGFWNQSSLTSSHIPLVFSRVSLHNTEIATFLVCFFSNGLQKPAKSCELWNHLHSPSSHTSSHIPVVFSRTSLHNSDIATFLVGFLTGGLHMPICP